MSTNATKRLVDNNAEWSYPSHGPSSDAVMHQCAGTGQETQFRFVMLDEVELGDDAIDVNFDRTNFSQTGFQDPGFIDHVNDIDEDGEFFHVFFVDSISSYWQTVGNSVASHDGAADRFPATNIALIRDSMIEFNMVSVLTHEMGHGIAGLGHIDETQGAGADNMPEECDNTVVSLRNVMCGTKWAGREFDPNIDQNVRGDPSDPRDQCQAMYEVGNGLPDLVDMH